MSRYINADALIPKINECVNGHYITDFDAVATILDAPSIDIVRCKECKWFDGEGFFCCYSNNPSHVVCVDEEDYCSSGEVRDE